MKTKRFDIVQLPFSIRHLRSAVRGCLLLFAFSLLFSAEASAQVTTTTLNATLYRADGVTLNEKGTLILFEVQQQGAVIGRGPITYKADGANANSPSVGVLSISIRRNSQARIWADAPGYNDSNAGVWYVIPDAPTASLESLQRWVQGTYYLTTTTGDGFTLRAPAITSGKMFRGVVPTSGFTGYYLYFEDTNGTRKFSVDSTGVIDSVAGINATKLQGRDMANTAPTNGQAIVWSSSNNRWQPGTVSGGSGGTIVVQEVDGSPSFAAGTLEFLQSSGFVVTDQGGSVGRVDLAAVPYAKLNLSGSIVNSDVAAGAAIGYSKLNLSSSIVNADVAAGAAIAYSKLNLGTSIVNADVNAAAAIAYSKLNLTGGIVNSDVNASAAIDWSKVSKTGASLADLPTRSASDLSSGTLPDARFPATLPAASGVNLTNLNASNLSAGTIPAARGQEVWAVADLSDITAKKGNSTIVQMQTGATTTDDCAKFDANGNLVSAGAPCGSGGGGTTPVYLASSYASFALAEAAAEATGGTLVIDTDFTISTSTTLATNVEMVFEGKTNAKLTINSGVTLTIGRQVVAPQRQIFVVSEPTAIRWQTSARIYPEWFGAIDDWNYVTLLGTDNTTAIKAAFDSLNGSAGGDILFYPKNGFAFASPLSLDFADNVHFKGTHAHQNAAVASLIYTGTGSGNAILVTNAGSTTFENMRFQYTQVGFTGALIQLGGGVGDTQFVSIYDSAIEGTGGVAGNAIGIVSLNAIHWTVERTNFSSLENAIVTTGTTNVVEINRCTANFMNDYAIVINSGVQAMNIRTFSVEGGTDGQNRFIKLGASASWSGSTVIDSWVGDFSGPGPFDPIVDLSGGGTYHAITFQGGYWEGPGVASQIGIKLGSGDVAVRGMHFAMQNCFDVPTNSGGLTLENNFFTSSINLFTNDNWQRYLEPLNMFGNKMMAAWSAANPANVYGGEQGGLGGILLYGSGANDPVRDNAFKAALNIGGNVSGSSVDGVSMSSGIRVSQNLTGYADGSLIVQAGTGSSSIGFFTGATPTERLGITAGGALSLKEITAPSTPGANSVYLYAKDTSGVSSLFFKKDDGTEVDLGTGGSGSGDVTGQASSVDSEIALFSGTTGKVIKRASGSGFVKATSGVYSTAAQVNLASEVTGTLADGSLSANVPLLNAANVFTALQTVNPGTTPADGVLIDIAQPSSTGQRDSHNFVMRGTSFDSSGHNADWKMFVDVNGNAGASRLTFQSRIDAGSYATRFQVEDTGGFIVPSGVTATSLFLGGGSGTTLFVQDGNARFANILIAGSGPTTLTDSTGKILSDALNDVAFANFVPATAASKLIGRGSASGAGDFEEITIGSGLTMTGTTLSASGGGGSPDGADGSIQFATSGTFDSDNANLFWDDSNNRLGLGTASPGALLTLVSAASGDQLRLGQDTSNYFKIGRDTSTGYLRFEGTQTGNRDFQFVGGNIGLEAAGGFYFGATNQGLIARDNSTGTLNVTLQAVNNANFAILSTTGSFVPPKMTTTQRDAISSPTEGSVIYNTTTQVPNFYNGSTWEAAAGGVAWGAITGTLSSQTDLQSALDAKATLALDNLASVAINTSLISDTNNTDDLGSSSIKWKDLYLAGNIVGSGTANRIGTATTNDANADWMFSASAAAKKPIVIQGAASQSVPYLDLQQSSGQSRVEFSPTFITVRNSSGTTLATIDMTSGAYTIQGSNSLGATYVVAQYRWDTWGNIGTNSGALTMNSTSTMGWSSNAAWFNAANDTMLSRAGAANVRHGAADAASPVAQTISTQGSRSGTDSNVGGGNLTIQSGIGTGTGTLSSLILRSPILVGSGTGAQTPTTGLTIKNGAAMFSVYTVATLPASPTAGMTVYVSDGDAALAWGSTIVNSGSGATTYLVWYNGANWTVVGK